MIRLLALRELRSLFSMPSTWFALAVLQFIFAWFFLARLDAFLEIQPQLAQLANPPGATVTVAAPVFHTAALLVLMAPVPLMLYTLSLGTNLDHGLLLGNMLGLLLLASSYIALGLYVSALTVQPVIAAIGALAVSVGLWLADIGAAAEDSPWHLISPFNHFQNFNAGLLDSGDIAFFVLFSLFFLLMAMRRIHNNRRYG